MKRDRLLQKYFETFRYSICLIFFHFFLRILIDLFSTLVAYQDLDHVHAVVGFRNHTFQ